MKIIIAWIKKYILHVISPSTHFQGYDFEYDYLRSLKKKRIKDLEHQIVELSLRISELEAELEESRAKEGKGALETAVDAICNLATNLADAFSNMDSEQLRELMSDVDEEDDNDT